jgi:hypothetical protein
LKKIKTSNGCRTMKEERCTDNINKGKIANNLYCALLELKKKLKLQMVVEHWKR